MYITIDSLRNMARVKKNPNYSSHIVRHGMTEYEKQRDRNIEKNNRVLQELGLPFRKTNEHIRRRELIMEEEEDYIPNEDQGVNAELEDWPYDSDNFTMRRPTLERQTSMRKSSTVHKVVASGKRVQADQLDDACRVNQGSTSCRSTLEQQRIKTRSTSAHAHESNEMPREEHTNSSHDVERELSNRLMDTPMNHNVEDENQIGSSNQASLPRRGKTKCLYWKRKRDAHPTKVEIEIPPELKRIVGANSTQFISEASYLMKQLMPLDVEKWDDIQPEKKRKYFMKLKEMFKLPQGCHVDNAIERRCKVWYRKWRYDLKQKAYTKYTTVADRRNNPPKEVDPDQWKWLVNYWDSDKFRRRSETNTKNQTYQKMLAKVGTKSIASTFYEMLQKPIDGLDDLLPEDSQSGAEEDEEPYYLQLWKIQRQKKDGTWSDEHAEKAYKDLQVVHQKELEKHGVDNLTPQEAFTRVLKHRKGSHHQRGMGQGVLAFTSCQNQGINEDAIQDRIDAEVNRRVSEQLKGIHESYDARLRALEERLGSSSSA